MERILLYNSRLRDSDELSINITTIIVLWKLGLGGLTSQPKMVRCPNPACCYVLIKFY